MMRRYFSEDFHLLLEALNPVSLCVACNKFQIVVIILKGRSALKQGLRSKSCPDMCASCAAVYLKLEEHNVVILLEILKSNIFRDLQ